MTTHTDIYSYSQFSITNVFLEGVKKSLQAQDEHANSTHRFHVNRDLLAVPTLKILLI